MVVSVPTSHGTNLVVRPEFKSRTRSPGQVHQKIYIGLIPGVILTVYPNIGLVWCILTPHPYRVKKLIFSIKRLICLLKIP